MCNKSLFLLAFIAFSLALRAADPTPQITAFDASEVASTYVNLVRETLINNFNGALKKNPAPGNIVKNFEVGDIITTANWKESVYSLDDEALAKSSGMLKNFYKFLSDSGFIVDAGTIGIRKLLFPEKYPGFKAKPHKATGFLHKLAQEFASRRIDLEEKDDGTSIAIMAKKRNTTYFFHESWPSMVLRHKENEKNHNTIANIPIHLQPLFKEDEHLRSLLNKAREINEEILARINEFSKILDENAADANAALTAIKEYEKTPFILINKIDRNLKIAAAQEIVRELKVALPEHLERAYERGIALNTMIPSPIDVFLLYSYYLLEESKADLFGRQFNIIGYLSDLDELSISRLLAASASVVLEQLGYTGDAKNEVSKKKYAPAKKNVKSKKKKSHGKAKNVAKKIKKEEVEDDEESPEEVIAQPIANDIPIVAASVSGEKNHANNSPKKEVILNSLNDTAHPNNVTLPLKKSFRLLDTVSRLLAYVLSMDYENSASGSLHIMLIPDKAGDKLVVATKATRATPYIIEALQGIVTGAKSEGKNSSIRALKNEYQQLREARRKSTDKNQVRKSLRRETDLRYLIDLKKLYVALNSTDTDPILCALKNVLNNASTDSIVILPNHFNYHSEMVLAEYDNIKPLGFITWNNKSIPYQYLGGALLSCGHCNICLKGGINIHGLNRAPMVDMPLFSRGSYKVYYPGYVPARKVCIINQVNKLALLKRLKEQDGLEFVRNCTEDAIIKMQYSELSDSESDGE